MTLWSRSLQRQTNTVASRDPETTSASPPVKPTWREYAKHVTTSQWPNTHCVNFPVKQSTVVLKLNWRNMGFLRYVARTLLMPHGLKGNRVLPIILPRSRDNDSFREELVELGFIPENVTFINQSWLLQVFIATEVSSSNDRRILSSLLEEAAASRILSKQALRYLGLYFEWNISFPWS